MGIICAFTSARAPGIVMNCTETIEYLSEYQAGTLEEPTSDYCPPVGPSKARGKCAADFK